MSGGLNKHVFPLPLWEWGKPHGSTQHFSAQWEDVPTTLVTWNGRRQELEGQDCTYLLGGKNSIELLWWCQEAFSKGDLTSGDFDTNGSGLGFWRSRLSLWKWQWNCQYIEHWWDLTSRGCRDDCHSLSQTLSPPRLNYSRGSEDVYVHGHFCEEGNFLSTLSMPLWVKEKWCLFKSPLPEDTLNHYVLLKSPV